MGLNTVMGATMQCSFGAAPAVLNVLPTARVLIEGRPAATIAETATGVNVPPFGMCMSLSNPAVAAATAAALGVLTPQPCVPLITAPWQPGAARTTVGGKPALTSGSMCVCAWGGAVSLTNTGAVKTQSN
jgi:hypothetical protein